MKTVFKNDFLTAQVDDSGMFTFDRNATQHGSVVVPIDSLGRIMLIREKRAGVPVPVIGVVKGAADDMHESYSAVARRELREEIGVTCGELHISQAEPYAFPGMTQTRGRVCFAFNCVQTHAQELDHGEDIEHYGTFTMPEIEKMITRGVINDAESISAILIAKLTYSILNDHDS